MVRVGKGKSGAGRASEGEWVAAKEWCARGGKGDPGVVRDSKGW